MSGARLADVAADATTDAEAEAQLLRSVSRQLPTGIAVLTAAHEGAVHAATVSTVCVVSQRPLTVSVSLRRESFMTRLIAQSGHFMINVLSSRQALLADWFANPQRPAGARQFDLVKWETDPESGLPVLKDRLAQLACRLTGTLAVGDADALLIAPVVSGRAASGRPLINFAGRLHDVEFRDVVRRQGWREPSAPAGLE
ncbi:flavin reductase family protein [Streptomyces sp. NPDC053048]|uniref:flavin reductase family protein n=1 Tax=Streptomyces sp. NPDC053048 TaxID=3365694 RepID=UPI0037D76F7F